MNKNSKKREPIAIIGMGCRYPGDVFTLQDFWKLLYNKQDAVTDVPKDRWDNEVYYDPDYTRPAKIHTTQGGFVSNIDKFDAGFFGISPIEALRMDPQHRFLLEVTYHAFEDAGIKLNDISGTQTGVFIGISSHDYEGIISQPFERVNMSGNTHQGVSACIASNRISFTFNLKGPSFSVDTACSSSLIAAHLACRSIWSNESSMAIVGGVNMLIRPEMSIGFSKGSFLSPDGRCKAFDARANGYVRGEGVGVVILKPLSKAIEDNDRVYATIIGSAINQDGRTPGLTVPGLDSQMAMLVDAYRDANISPLSVQYVEAHGTGTSVGDPIEAKALGTVLGKKRPKGESLLVGSVKTNIGHLEPASGVAGLIKTALAITNKTVPPNLHFTKPNPNINMDELKLEVPTENNPWPIKKNTMYAGVNSFGFGGANAHVVLKNYTNTIKKSKDNNTVAPMIFTLSARSEDALRAQAVQILDYIFTTKENIKDICYTFLMRRTAFEYRLSISCLTKDDVVKALSAFLKNETFPGMNYEKNSDIAPNIAFVYSGQGSQWWAMGHRLYKENKIFRETIDKLDRVFTKLGWQKKVKKPLISELLKNEKSTQIDKTRIVQPLLFSMQVALTEVWKSMGVVPSAIIPHSLGEVAAGYVSGAISLEDAVRVLLWRVQCQERVEGQGGMLAVGLSQEEAEKIAGSYKNVEAAVINGPEDVTLSGDIESLNAISRELESKNIFNRMIKVTAAFHSTHMEHVKDEFMKISKPITTHKTNAPYYSSVTGSLVKGKELNREYYFHNIRKHVLFYQAMQNAIKDGFTTFIEISPHTILSNSIVKILERVSQKSQKGIVLPTLHRKQDEYSTLFGSFGKLWIHNANIDYKTYIKNYGGNQCLVSLPLYPYQHETYWLESEESRVLRIGKVSHPHLSEQRKQIHEQSDVVWDIKLDSRLYPYIDDHRVQGPMIYPAAGQMDIVLSAARESFKNDFNFLKDINFVSALFLPDTGISPRIHLEISGDEGNFRVCSQVPDTENWVMHSFGKINRMDDSFPADAIDLSSIQQRLTKQVPMDKFYASWHQGGLMLGKRFQSIKRLWYGKNESLGEIIADDSIIYDVFKHTIHPTVLDGCFQAAFGTIEAMTRLEVVGTYLPVGIKGIKLYQKPTTLRVWSYCRTAGNDTGKIQVDITIFDDNGNRIMDVKSLTAQYIEGSRGETTFDPIVYQYNPVWKSQKRKEEIFKRDLWNIMSLPKNISQVLEKDASERMSHPLIREYGEKYEIEINDLCVNYILSLFKDLGFVWKKNAMINESDFMKKYKIIPKYSRLVHRMLKILGDRGYVAQKNTDWEIINIPVLPKIAPAETISNMLEKYKHMPYELEVLNRCGGYLKPVIQGNMDPIQLLFPENAWESMFLLYAEGPMSKPANEVAQTALSEIISSLPKDHMLRILEVGAGTGGIAQALFPVCPKDRTEYFFTDLSTMFFAKAKERFSEYPFINYSLFDLEKDNLQEQYAPHSFDFVVASDVIHATRDIKKSLNSMKKLLAPGGVVCLLEVTQPPLYLDLTFGLTEGWWLFDDMPLRKTHATMPKEQWIETLKECGYVDIVPVQFLTDKNRSNAAEHTLFIARNSDTFSSLEQEMKKEKTETNSVIIITNTDITEQLSEILKLDGKNIFLNNSLETLCDDIKTKNIQKIVYMCDALLDTENTNDIDRIIADSCTGAMNLIKTLSSGLKGHPVTIYFVTRSVNGISDTAPIYAPLWGLARVMMNEYTTINMKLIDISNKPSEEEIKNLAKEFFTESTDREIVLKESDRLITKLDKTTQNTLREKAQKKVPASGYPYKAMIRDYGIFDSIYLEEENVKPLGDDEVKIDIKASALNFRDIMLAMGLLSDESVEGGMFGKNFGMECSGIVSSAGKNVTEFKQGDEVVASSGASLAGVVNVHKDFVCKKPSNMTFEEVSTIPVAYTTAYYALIHLARLQKGERVLVHTASGGVGIAAINLIHHYGGEVFATAGTDEKREFLKSLGVKHIFDSRKLDFKDKIMSITNGKGVDIILNTIAGKAITQNFHSLSHGGRFIELGKTDIYSNKRINLRPFGNNVSYFGVDLDRLCIHQSHLIKSIIEIIFRENLVVSHPYHSFPVSRLNEAFAFMSKANHIGKVVITMDEKEISIQPPASLTLKKDAGYIVTGGCAGFGLHAADWMSTKGAGNLVLVNRSGVKNEDDKKIISAIEARGTKVFIERADITNIDDVNRILKNLEEKNIPLKGIIHSAMVLDDMAIENMDTEHLMRVIRPKVIGALNLHNATLAKNLDYFVMFSSISSVFGFPGQGNYAAANMFLDTITAYRKHKGLPAVTVNWGALGAAGFVARNEEVQQRLISMGCSLFPLELSLNVLEQVMLTSQSQTVAADIKWQMFKEFLGENARGKFAHLIEQEKSNIDDGNSMDLKKILAQSNEEKQSEVLTDNLRKFVAKIIGLSVEKLPTDVSLLQVGFDSLMANQLRNWIQTNLNIDFPLLKIMQGPSIKELAVILLQLYSAQASSSSQENFIEVRCIKKNPDAKLRLFCFPYLGGSATVYDSWSEKLPDSIELYSIQASEKAMAIKDIETLLNEYEKAMLALLDKPFAVYGHSHGARLGTGLVARLHSKHNKKPEALFTGSYISKQLVQKYCDMIKPGEEDSISDDMLNQFLKEFDTPVNIISNDEHMQNMIRKLRSDMAVGVRLQRSQETSKKKQETIPCPVHIFSGEHDPSLTVDKLPKWDEYSLENSYKIETLPGSHLFLHDEACSDMLVKRIVKTLVNV
jgi:acyl transferase domain-containing protein/NADPH:quinone reductase-like Zn-dependent oxidoreductase/surfactin synthase thioesterase subunit/ubiquinone/menaquinone biosynthesis C-methylase UbiE/NAD(P)-dependent dehydrogenase (short-subunit alcohol dehydrogenase family)